MRPCLGPPDPERAQGSGPAFRAGSVSGGNAETACGVGDCVEVAERHRPARPGPSQASPMGAACPVTPHLTSRCRLTLAPAPGPRRPAACPALRAPLWDTLSEHCTVTPGVTTPLGDAPACAFGDEDSEGGCVGHARIVQVRKPRRRALTPAPSCAGARGPRGRGFGSSGPGPGRGTVQAQPASFGMLCRHGRALGWPLIGGRALGWPLIGGQSWLVGVTWA